MKKLQTIVRLLGQRYPGAIAPFASVTADEVKVVLQYRNRLHEFAYSDDGETPEEAVAEIAELLARVPDGAPDPLLEGIGKLAASVAQLEAQLNPNRVKH